jgi:hypothetical protein
MPYKISTPKKFMPFREKRTPKEIDKYIMDLKEIEQKGKMNDNLRFAIVEMRKALEKGDYELASELSGVKSYIVGEDKNLQRGYHFGEDMKHNEKVFGGKNIYGMLDNINFNLAMHTGKMPSGMVVISSAGAIQREKPKKIHPTIQLMNKEEAFIWKKARSKDGL